MFMAFLMAMLALKMFYDGFVMQRNDPPAAVVSRLEPDALTKWWKKRILCTYFWAVGFLCAAGSCWFESSASLGSAFGAVALLTLFTGFGIHLWNNKQAFGNIKGLR